MLKGLSYMLKGFYNEFVKINRNIFFFRKALDYLVGLAKTYPSTNFMICSNVNETFSILNIFFAI